MHNQHTLHLTNTQFKLVQDVLSLDSGITDASVLVEVMVDNGIREYPAQVLVRQHKEAQHNQLRAA